MYEERCWRGGGGGGGGGSALVSVCEVCQYKS